MTKLVYGVGFNDRKYPVFVDGEKVKSYILWQAILERCYCRKYQESKPTYSGCKVSDNFKNYSYFYEWAVEQIGYGLTGWELDKDIICKGNKLYSEETCAFVPSAINVFFTTRGSLRGEQPIGVFFHKTKNRFIAQCSLNGRSKHLGHFKTAQEAYQVYKDYKEQLCKDLANQWKLQIDPRVYEAMMTWTVEPF